MTRFADFAALGRRLEATAGRLDKRRLVARFLAAVEPDEVALAVAFLTAKPFPTSDPRVLGVRGLRGWKREEWKAAAAFAVPPTVHWVLLFLLRGAQTRRDFDFHFFEPAQWANLLSRFAAVCARIATTEMREVALPLTAILLYLLVTRRGFADVLLPALTAQILFYCLAFSVSSFDPMYAVDGAFRRIAMTLFPVLALVLGARIPVRALSEGASSSSAGG